ncbi:hypothetical protein STEG23_006388 [Scotinomys teguina]
MKSLWYWPNAYITKKSLRFSFLLHDPSDFFKLVSFFYRWDFGDGTLLITDNPVTYYNYSSAGTFTVNIRVVAEREQTKPDTTKVTVQKNGDFSASLNLWEALQGIQVLRLTLLQTFQKVTMTMNFFGSPPLDVCWGLKPQCLPLEDRECHPVLVTTTSFNLSHMFQDSGDYCFIFSAENAISKAQSTTGSSCSPPPSSHLSLLSRATLITCCWFSSMYMTVLSATQQKDRRRSGLKCCCSCAADPLSGLLSEYLRLSERTTGCSHPFYKPRKPTTCELPPHTSQFGSLIGSFGRVYANEQEGFTCGHCSDWSWVCTVQ